jgi:hypothetical protein
MALASLYSGSGFNVRQLDKTFVPVVKRVKVTPGTIGEVE